MSWLATMIVARVSLVILTDATVVPQSRMGVCPSYLTMPSFPALLLCVRGWHYDGAPGTDIGGREGARRLCSGSEPVEERGFDRGRIHHARRPRSLVHPEVVREVEDPHPHPAQGRRRQS